MAGQREDTDDLIAELSKLMATDSKPGAAAKPAPAGFEPRVASAPQTIRIPGVSQPVPTTGSPAPVDRFDFARTPQAAPAPAPTSNWQDRLGGKPAVNSDPLAAFPPPASPADRQEPSIGSGNWRPAISPNEPAPKPAANSSGFDFDFGFNRERPEPAPKPATSPAPAPVAERPVPAPSSYTPAPAAPPPAVAPARPAPQPASFTPAYSPPPAPVVAPQPVQQAPQPVASTRDAIADLIAAELGNTTQATFDDAPAPQQFASASEVNFVPPAPVQAAPAPRPQPQQAPVQQRQVPESDRFSTAPVFGLGNRPAGESVAPKPQLDPMDEIENLIGEAVRVELNMPQPQVARSSAAQTNRAPQAAPQMSPAVPPLNAQFAPRRAGLRETEPVSRGDDAILAAAAASGSEVGRIDSPFGDQRQDRPRKASRRERQTDQRQASRQRFDRDVEERSGGAFRQLIVPAIAGTILVAGGFALYWAIGMGHHDGKAPVLTADATPAKTVPAKAADTAPHSVVMDELGGNAPAASKETLVSRDQSAGTDTTQVASAAATAAAAPDGGLANRKVRTVTVRPDGTIVSGDDSVAGATQLPVGRPNVPSLPGVSVANAAETPAPATAADAAVPGTTTTAATDAASSANPAMAGTVNADAAPVADNSAPAGDPTAPVPLPPLQRTQVASADDTTTADDTAQPATTSPRPTSSVNAVRTNAAKPMDLIGNLATASDNSTPAPQPARQAPAASDAAAVDTSAPGGSVAHVQLSSQPSAAGAQSSAGSLQKKFGSLWGSSKLQIVKVDLSKGTYYRVMLPTTSLQSAQQLCASIKSSGGDCIAANG